MGALVADGEDQRTSNGGDAMMTIDGFRDDIAIISRASTYGEKPVAEAFKIKVQITDRRVVDDPRKIPLDTGSDGKWWYENGTNHRVENGQIARDMGYHEVWAIKIPKDGLAKWIAEFIKREENIVISMADCGLLEIVIYDTWIE